MSPDYFREIHDVLTDFLPGTVKQPTTERPGREKA